MTTSVSSRRVGAQDSGSSLRGAQDSKRRRKQDKAPAAVLPMLVWVVTTFALLALPIVTLGDRVGLTPSDRVVRRGEATIVECAPDLLTLGTMQRCVADVSWEPRDRWAAHNMAPLNTTGPYIVSSRIPLSGTVDVEGHPVWDSPDGWSQESIIVAGQPSGQIGWYFMFVPASLLISGLLGKFVFLPWIRRRNAQEDSNAGTQQS